jgi:hypothetical protein
LAINLALTVIPPTIIISLVIFSLLSLFYYFKIIYNFLALHNITLSAIRFNSYLIINPFMSLSILTNLIFSVLILLN